MLHQFFILFAPVAPSCLPALVVAKPPATADCRARLTGRRRVMNALLSRAVRIPTGLIQGSRTKAKRRQQTTRKCDNSDNRRQQETTQKSSPESLPTSLPRRRKFDGRPVHGQR